MGEYEVEYDLFDADRMAMIQEFSNNDDECDYTSSELNEERNSICLSQGISRYC